MRRLQTIVLFLLAVVGGSVGSAWYFHQAPIETDRQAVQAIVAAELAKQPKPVLDKAAVTAIVDDALAKQSKSALDTDAVKSIVTQMLAADDSKLRQNSPLQVAALDPKTLNPLIEKYLMGDPQVLNRMSAALDRQTKADQALKDRQAIAQNADAIFRDPGAIVVGNPKGDVTLVEMFDYNCGYCRGALPDLATLISQDKNLRVVLKEFPILSPQSVDAARVAVEVAKSGADYWTFHQALFTSRGQVDASTALDEAKALGLDPAKLKAGMQSAEVSDVIQKSYDLAKSLNVTGTPTYIIGDEMIPGAVPIGDLRQAIANMRACGSALSCPKSS